jgi:predicted RNA-binding Zn-ribbon protein involved in translation (DUF1610 family)
LTGVTRFGERTGQGAASFRCAACGEMAAVVKVARTGASAGMGSPLGCETYDRDGIVVDYFLGTAWKSASAATLDAVLQIVSSQAPDPVTLRRIGWELASFYCPDCGLNYCRADWNAYVLVDDDFYDYTMGICPGGHRHMIAGGRRGHKARANPGRAARDAAVWYIADELSLYDCRDGS